MRVGVVSDVHNNVEALTYALERLRLCDVVVSLGDLVSDYRVDVGILDLARDARLLGIVGNHEKSILLHPGSQIRSRLAPATLDYLQDLPAKRLFELDGRRVLLAHGAPWDNPADYRCEYVIESDRKVLARIESSGEADLVLLGHTHLAMAVRIQRTLVLNPGSCGEARDRANNLSFAELDGATGTASIFAIQRGMEPERLLSTDF
jgi:putative phosphoesterase